MNLLFALLAAGLAGGIALGAIRWARRRQERLSRARLAGRLAEAYRAASPTAATRPLVAPAGEGAAQADGLYLAIGEAPFRRVPWRSVRAATPAGRGQIVVSIERVGDVVVSGGLGRPIWRYLAAPGENYTERARADRV